MNTLRVALAQINLTLGALEANSEKIIAYTQDARDKHQADIVIFSELTVCGYPPQDLLLHQEFNQHIQQQLEHIITSVSGICMVIGYPKLEQGKLYNTSAAFYDGKRLASYSKQHLPNYQVFDEKRYFAVGKQEIITFDYKDTRCCLLICEDIWQEQLIKTLAPKQVDIILCLNASPFALDKPAQRMDYLQAIAKNHQLAIAYINLVGAQDDLVFDGSSVLLNQQGKLIAQAKFCHSDLVCADIYHNSLSYNPPPLEPIAQIHQVLCLGLTDYLKKNNFTKVVLGLSGGIDSAVTLALALECVGAENVKAVMLATKFTSQISLDAAKQLAQILKVEYINIDIQPNVDLQLETLQAHGMADPSELVKQNIQARIRANILMSIANQDGSLLLTTGNKSELAMGYTTLYGDMAGGFNPIKDIFKTQVYCLARYINKEHRLIPQIIIDREPSAELSLNQLDSDSLPDYASLDKILNLYMQDKLAAEQIVAQGFDSLEVKTIINRLHANQHKRYQAALGVRVSNSSFDKDWRYPITSAYT
jgi:NAD+ synthase (glutamine-hydrolysing)